jgi:hypothetical protein
MNVHLVTMIGYSITTLEPMLEHYRSLGIDSYWIYVHMDHSSTAFREQMLSIATRYKGAEVFPVFGDWMSIEQAVFNSISSCPDDWFILADQDEFQLYPSDLAAILDACDRAGFDHINGCFVDRISADGSLSVLVPTLPIWEQFPLGAFLTKPVCAAGVRKVVAAKGSITVSGGHHYAANGNPMPIEDLFIEVHYFKWIAGVKEYLNSRSFPDGNPNSLNTIVWLEGQRFLRYFSLNGNKINIAEPAIMAAHCNPNYPHCKRSVLAVRHSPRPNAGGSSDGYRQGRRPSAEHR